eukprot:3321276-Amphidinium_carterae.1
MCTNLCAYCTVCSVDLNCWGVYKLIRMRPRFGWQMSCSSHVTEHSNACLGTCPQRCSDGCRARLLYEALVALKP